jgi:tetratricopeptide (TPR) repeat protein
VSLLWDDLKAVRIEAARLLAFAPEEQLPEPVRAQRAQAIQEYVAVQELNAERPEAQVNLGILYADQGRYQDAELAYRKAIKLQRRFIPAYVNLAQILSQRGREKEVGGLLGQGLEIHPDSADLHHALGLSLIRQKRPDEAVTELAEAAALAPENTRYGYVYAVALQSSGKVAEAIAVLEAVHQRRPGDIDTLSALIAYHREAGEPKPALGYARKLEQLAPGNPSVARLVRALEAATERTAPSTPESP